jgi:hypothetical protein
MSLTTQRVSPTEKTDNPAPSRCRNDRDIFPSPEQAINMVLQVKDLLSSLLCHALNKQSTYDVEAR